MQTSLSILHRCVKVMKTSYLFSNWSLNLPLSNINNDNVKERYNYR